jgi:hypothetical protein
MLTGVTQNSRLPAGDRLRDDPRNENESRPAAGLLRCALDRVQVGPERFGSKGTNHNSYWSILLNAGRREVSICRLRRARAVLAACNVLPDGNRGTGCWCTWHRGPRRTARLPEVPTGTWAGAACLIGLLRVGQKVPSKAGSGAISRRRSGTTASVGRYSRWHPQRVERFKTGTSYGIMARILASRSQNYAEARHLGTVLVAEVCGALATIRQFFLLGNFFVPYRLSLTNYYPIRETKE